jgi:hypothetical protein
LVDRAGQQEFIRDITGIYLGGQEWWVALFEQATNGRVGSTHKSVFGLVSSHTFPHTFFPTT